MKRHFWLMVILLGLSGCENPPAVKAVTADEPTPIAKYISQSVYTTSKKTENEKGFILGKEMPNSAGKYIFMFYNDHIILKVDTITNFVIDEIDRRNYPHNTGYFVRNSKGERHLITVSHGSNSNHVDLYEDFRNGTFNRLTMIICQ